MTIIASLRACMISKKAAIIGHDLCFIILISFESTIIECTKAGEPLLYHIIVILSNTLSLKSCYATGFRAIDLSWSSIRVKNLTVRLTSIFTRSRYWIILICALSCS